MKIDSSVETILPISEGGGEPVVVTLVDNRQAASLENLATRSATEQLRHGAAAATAAANVSEHHHHHHHHQPVRLPKSIDEATTTTIDDADNNNNNNNDVNSNNETESTKTTTTTTDDVVVVVRAERKSHNVDVVQQVAVGSSDEDDKDDSATTTTTQAAASVSEIDDDKKPQQQQDVEPIMREEQQQPIVVVVPPQTSQEATADGLAEEGSATAAAASVAAVPSPEPTQHEEIPSFNEWAQKRLEEAEKKKTGHPNASIQTANGGGSGRGLGGMRMHSKNYASPDCGAKIVAVNPEAQSAKNVLVSTRDEYMLNTCKTRIWFVVQLCEAIQAKKIELANFELFSSSPKDLSVYVSDRFPSRDWSNVGQFQARDERDVQSFQLQPQLFGRFIKVELHTHYGSEHFCPISLFRAYGTSEFEVLETETESDQAHAERASSADGDIAIGDDFEASESDDDDLVFIDEASTAGAASDSQQASRNNPPRAAAPNSIFGSARDAVLSLVRKAAEVLVKSRDLRSSNNITKIQESIEGDVLGNETLDDCTTPVYNVACKDCDDRRFARVFQLISCKRHYLEALLGAPFLRRALIESHLCSSSAGFEVLLQDGGDDACGDSAAAAARGASGKGVNRHGKARLLAALFTPDHVIALCNVLAAKEQRLFANVSHRQRQNETMADARQQQQQQQGTAIDRDKAEPSTTASVLAASKTTIILASDTTSVARSKTDGPRQASPTLGLVVESATKQIRPTKTVSIEEAKKLSILDPVDSSKSHHLHHHASSEEISAGQSETSSISAADAAPEAASKRLASSSPKASQSEQSQVPSTQDTVSKRETSIASDKEQQARVDGADKDTKAARMEEASQNSRTRTEQLAKAKADEQDSKDQLNFESFDFEVESNGGGGGGGVKPDSPIASQPANTATQQQQHQQKESVFLRLSNRIKVLERNMSLSSQYLEELSRRYKKQVEEMQRTLERAMSAMSEESRKGEERETKRLEEVTGLRRQIDVLTHLLEDLYRERESWSLRSCLSHGLFCLINVTIVLAVLSYCKRGAEEEYVDDVNQVTTADGRRDVLARSTSSNKARSYELVKQNTSQMAKKPKKRRPSEIAAQVSGNYEQLMIESVVSSSLGNPTTKAGRRKRRKKDSLVMRSASIKETSDDSRMVMHSRSASASDALCYGGLETTNAGLAHQKQSRPDSAPDSSIAYFPVPKQQSQAKSAQDKRIQILKMNEANAVAVDKSDDDDEEIERKDDENGSVDGDNFGQPDSTTSSIRCKPMKIMSPSFMRTALSSRSKRLSFSSGKKTFHRLGSSTIIQDSLSELEVCSSTNGHFEESDGSASTTPSKKEKKTSWPKRMVRRFF
ncbi:hypothetical protein TKK_0013132 [Trichogramma kaykai]